jgi:hypothetical protein
MFFHRAVWVDAQTYYLDGALRLEKRIEHWGMTYDDKKVIRYVTHSSLGLIPLSLVSIDKSVYVISSETWERLDLDTNKVGSVPNLPHSALNAGCCQFNDSILVIGGLGNWRV